MIQEVVSVGLPVDERWKIIKNRFEPAEGAHSGMKRICVITGTHGDELEGQYVCYELARRINAHPELLHGIVDIYPALNPLGIDSITRSVPMFDLDMNRIFPGTNTGATTEYVAAQIMQDMASADMTIDIHASNIFLRETPQVRVNELCRCPAAICQAAEHGFCLGSLFHNCSGGNTGIQPECHRSPLPGR